MVSLIFKYSIGVLLLSAVISFLNQTGAITSHPTMQINTSQEKWDEMVQPGDLSDTNGLQAQQDAYTGAGFNVKDFLLGTIYVKGILDDFAQDQWPYTLATSILQTVLYAPAMLSFIGWVLGRLNSP